MNIEDINLPLESRPVSSKQIANIFPTSARICLNILKKEIIDFEQQLNPEYEIGLQFASFGHSVLMLIEKIECRGSDYLLFYGSIDNSPARLVQHVSQLNFILMAVKRESSEPRHPIGFIISD